MELFTQAWSALREAVAALPDRAFAAPSGCAGWTVRDLVGHLVIDAQDVLITLATPAEDAPTADALSYWTPTPTRRAARPRTTASPSASPPPTRTRTCCATISRTSAPPPDAPRSSPRGTCPSPPRG